MAWTLIVFIVGACLSFPSFSLPLPNTEVTARDSLPNLLAAVLSSRNGQTVTASPYNQKRIQDSRASFEDFRISHRNEPLKRIPAKSDELISSSKSVYYDQRTFTTANKIPKRKIQQQSNPNHFPLFLVLENYGHSANNNILSKKTKVKNIPSNSDHISIQNDLSLFLPVVVDDDNGKAEFRRLSIPSQFLPEFEHLSDHRPVEIVKDLHGYVFDINKKESQHLISFLRQINLESLESLESSDKSSSSEEEYLQGGNFVNIREPYENSEDDGDEIYSEEDDENEYDYSGEKSSEELKDMKQLITKRKQGVIATGRPLFFSSQAIGLPIVPTYSHHSLTDLAQKGNKGQSISRFPLRTSTFNSAILSKETSYEDGPPSKRPFQLPSYIYKVKTQEPNYDPISSVRSLSQTLSSEFVRRLPKINSFPSSSDSIKSTSGLGRGSIRLIPSILYTGEEVNHGISGVLGLGQPVSVGLLQ